MQSIIIGSNQAGQRLDKFLHKCLPLAGTGFLYKMLRKKNITLNGKKAQGGEILSLDDQICIFFSDETFEKFSGRKVALPRDASAGIRHGNCGGNDRRAALAGECKKAYGRLQGIAVLYEDDDFLILSKPAGLLTQKAAPGDCSLNEWLLGYLLAQNPSLLEELSTFRPSVCNRLDRNTSGIVLCGKSLKGLQYFSECIKKRAVKKYYRTICAGALRDAAQIQGRLVKDASKNRVTVSSLERSSGEDASYICTAYRPIEAWGDYTLLEVELITGKPHQIRAHLASIGHPVIGDYKYGSPCVNDVLKRKYGLEHQLLHAYRVEFPEADGGIGEHLSGRSVCAPYPELFLDIQKEIMAGNVSFQLNCQSPWRLEVQTSDLA